MSDARESFLTFLSAHPEIERDVALADFAAGLWVQRAMQWVHRSEHKEKWPTHAQWRDRNGPFDPAKHGARYRES